MFQNSSHCHSLQFLSGKEMEIVHIVINSLVIIIIMEQMTIHQSWASGCYYMTGHQFYFNVTRLKVNMDLYTEELLLF